MAAIVVLVGAAAVVVIDSGDEGARKQPSVEQQVSRADELPPGLRALLVRKDLDLDRVRSVDCQAGRQSLFSLRSSFVRLIQVVQAELRVNSEIARDIARAVTVLCRVDLRGGAIATSAKIGDTWVEIHSVQATGVPSGEVVDESGNAVGISDCPEATDAFDRAGVPVPTAYAHRCPSQRRIEEMIPVLRLALRDAQRIEASTGAQVGGL